MDKVNGGAGRNVRASVLLKCAAMTMTSHFATEKSQQLQQPRQHTLTRKCAHHGVRSWLAAARGQITSRVPTPLACSRSQHRARCASICSARDGNASRTDTRRHSGCFAWYDPT